MILRKGIFAVCIVLFCIVSCNSAQKEPNTTLTYTDVNVVGAMKNVMWKGELGSQIDLDTISNKNGLYGLGPVSYLKGEVLVKDGQTYVSKVTSDSTMVVEKQADVSAPFFVYANVTEWQTFKLPSSIKSIQDLETYIDHKTSKYKRPFAFKLTGEIERAIIHIQNLAEGAHVSSPEEAHKGQVKYPLTKGNVEIVGFFSTEHKGVFTHHDSFLHMHLMTKNARKMGHLDELLIKDMTLYLPNQ